MITNLFSVTSVVPTQLTGVASPFKTATFFGYKSFSPSGVPTNNTSNVLLGFNSGELPYQVPPGSGLNLHFLYTQAQDLQNIWVGGPTGNGVYIAAQY